MIIDYILMDGDVFERRREGDAVFLINKTYALRRELAAWQRRVTTS